MAGRIADSGITDAQFQKEYRADLKRLDALISEVERYRMQLDAAIIARNRAIRQLHSLSNATATQISKATPSSKSHQAVDHWLKEGAVD